MSSRAARSSIAASALAAASALLLALAAGDAHAYRAATAKEAKAIKRAFLKGRPGATVVRSIRISTADRRYASIAYSADITPPQKPTAASAAKAIAAPVPAVVKKSGASWKSVPKVPAKVKKDLKVQPRSALQVSGAVAATFTSAASCTVSDTFYSAQLYDRARDFSVRVEIPTWEGFKMYPALAVHSVAVVSVGNQALTPQWETGQAADAFAPSGELWIDRDRWGLIEAGLHHVIDGSNDTSTVSLSGSWACR